MTIQILLTAALLLISLYAFSQRGKSPLVSTSTFLCAAAALFFVWAPDSANLVARQIGVGRGADLVLYCWVTLSFFLLLNVHFKMRKRDEQLTAVARRLAILEAESQLARAGSNSD